MRTDTRAVDIILHFLLVSWLPPRGGMPVQFSSHYGHFQTAGFWQTISKQSAHITINADINLPDSGFASWPAAVATVAGCAVRCGQSATTRPFHALDSTPQYVRPVPRYTRQRHAVLFTHRATSRSGANGNHATRRFDPAAGKDHRHAARNAAGKCFA
ncbi:hypothetical protein KCP78_25615 [Salmonella enterica subsp. enterica]|nr:hypothetical protein KCP78_25615 [Salmonella enterica subsp. enterica]